LLSFPYGYSQSSEFEVVSSESLSSRKALLTLRKQINRYVDSLIHVLLDKDTPRENQVEILDEIRTIADINGKIILALNQMSQSDIGQNEINISKDIGRDEDISVWAKNQVELIRRKQLALNELEKRETELNESFWVNLALDGIVIVAGGILFFVPAVGPAISIPLTVGRVTHITLTGQKLGAALMAIGVLDSGLDVWDYFFGEEEKIPSFLSDIAFRDVLTKELFNILSSTNPSDRYLAINLLRSAAVDEEALIKDLLNVIQDERRPAEVRGAAVRAFRVISNMDEDLRGEVIDVLKEVVDESQIPPLRETSVNVLGELGEGMSEVAEYLLEYLLKTRDETNEDDKLRLMALIELGRNKDYFPISIRELAYWLEDRGKKERLAIQPEISGSFLDFLLLAEQGDRSGNHTIVVRGFIRSDMLNAELKSRFSETLLSWDDSPEVKALLREAYSNPAKDINSYVKNNLFGEGLSEENYGASQFLTNQISVLEEVKAPTIVILNYIEFTIEVLKKEHPNQVEAAEKLEEIVNSYKKILEAVQN